LIHQKRTLLQFPDILCLNAAASKEIEQWKNRYQQCRSCFCLPFLLLLWSYFFLLFLILVEKQNSTNSDTESSVRSWLPFRVATFVDDNGKVVVTEVPSIISQRQSHEIYHLTAIISHVSDESPKASRHNHLVAQVKVDPWFFEQFQMQSEQQEGWYLFNDFSINSTSPKEIVDFSFKVCE
jgi:hypothetical protein